MPSSFFSACASLSAKVPPYFFGTGKAYTGTSVIPSTVFETILNSLASKILKLAFCPLSSFVKSKIKSHLFTPIREV